MFLPASPNLKNQELAGLISQPGRSGPLSCAPFRFAAAAAVSNDQLSIADANPISTTQIQSATTNLTRRGNRMHSVSSIHLIQVVFFGAVMLSAKV